MSEFEEVLSVDQYQIFCGDNNEARAYWNGEQIELKYALLYISEKYNSCVNTTVDRAKEVLNELYTN